MKMSPEYLEETARHLASAGFQIEQTNTDYGDDVLGTTFLLTRPDESVELEHVLHPDGSTRYYFALDFHGLKARSFPLDTWRHWPDRVEFKLRVHPDLGSGFAFTIALPDGSPQLRNA